MPPPPASRTGSASSDSMNVGWAGASTGAGRGAGRTAGAGWAAAGGAAHLPGMIASLTTIPVIGIPIESKTLKGIDSLLSIVQMPAGIPVLTVAIGVAGAKNAALAAIAMLAVHDEQLALALQEYRNEMADAVRGSELK